MRVLFGVFVVAVFAMLAIAGVQAGLENAGDENTITDESWTPDPGNFTQLEESERKGAYYSNETTVKDSNGNEVDRGSDYVWNDGNGTVKAVQGGALDGETSATITYSFQQTDREQREMASLLAQLPRAVGTALPVFALLFLLVFARGG